MQKTANKPTGKKNYNKPAYPTKGKAKQVVKEMLKSSQRLYNAMNEIYETQFLYA